MKSKILTLLLLAIGLNVLSQSVPNTTTFSLQDVVSATGGSSLSAAFSNAVSGYFDPAYNNDTYAPSGSMLRFRNYGQPSYAGFDFYGTPVFVKSSGAIQYGQSGSGVSTTRCYIYSPDSKIGFTACSDGRVNMYDFSQSQIPVVNTYTLNLNTPLVFIKFCGSSIFVGDNLGRVYMSPSITSPYFHRVMFTGVGVMNDVIEVSSGIYIVSESGRIYRYIQSTAQLPIWNDSFEVVYTGSIDYRCITANDSFLLVTSASYDNHSVSSENDGDSWTDVSLFSNDEGIDAAATDGSNAYLVHYQSSIYTPYYIPSGSFLVLPITFTTHSDILRNVCSSNTSVSFLYEDSFEITSNSGSSWTRVNYSNTYPIYYISTY